MPAIQTIEVHPVSFPLREPFVTAGGQKSETHNVVIALTLTDGTRGRGEASSSIAMPAESQNNLIRALQSMEPELRGRPIQDYRTLVAAVWRLQPLHPTAAAAMECAILDAWSRTLKKNLANFLGEKSGPIETDLTLSLASPEDVYRRARAAVRRGFRRFKVKISGSAPAIDIERLLAAHRAAPKAILVADGNQGFNLSQAVDFAHRLRRAQISLLFLEQPFPKHDLRSMRTFRQRTHFPVFADEAVLSSADAVRVFESDAADGINVKVAKSGLLGALDLIQIARRFKKRLAIGCMEESKLGLAASVHLACGTGAFEWIDLDSVFLLDVPLPRGGFRIKGPKFSVLENRPGIGM